MDFWRSKIKKLNGFAIKPVIPSITQCELIAGDASGVGSYMARFSDKNETLLSRKFTEFERQQSSTYRESCGVCDLYTTANSPIVRFKGQQIMHVTDNQGVVAIFQKGLPRDALESMAVKVYMAANRMNITLHFVWKSRNEPIM